MSGGPCGPARAGRGRDDERAAYLDVAVGTYPASTSEQTARARWMSGASTP
jgi:hypothetical protein